MIENKFTKEYDRLDLFAKNTVEGFITGLHKSPYHGFSVEFAEHKVYNQEKLKLDQFEYYSGWYGNYPTGNVTLKDSYFHKKILIFDMIYKN